MTERYIITGGAGFIGANLVHYLHQQTDADLLVVDKLTYAGNERYLGELLEDDRVDIEVADIADQSAMDELWQDFQPSGVFHLAAESHVDRSISGPRPFIESNIVGTFTLLECARLHWVEKDVDGRFLHVSTDEVYGSLGAEGLFSEETPYDPSSPYSASKAASDHLVRAYHRTYGLDVVLTNCSNNFGPYQYPEKLIPVIITNIRDRQPLPVYGDGKNIRDWLYVEDHCAAIATVFLKGEAGEAYNIGANNEWTNIDLVHKICDLTDEVLGRDDESAQDLITFVTDRPGHDRRYAIDSSKIQNELGWQAAHDFDTALRDTIAWYLENLGPLWNK